MNLIYQSGFLKALGWSLADSLWQMGLVWLLYISITANGRKRNAAQRHNLALLSLAGGSAWFIAGFFIHLFSGQPASIQGAGKIFAGPSSNHSFFSAFMDGIAPYFSILYLAALLFLIARFLYQYQQSLRLFHTGIQEADASLAGFVEKMARKMEIPKKVIIGLSTIADTPLTIGFWKPVILFPVAVFNQLSISQVEAIIVHELHHIRRNDYLINLLLALTDIFLFFNPFARILSTIVKKERENSCDDKVIQLQYDPHQYGQALLILEQSRINGNNISVAATGKSAPMLLNRIKRLASHRPSPSPVLGKLSALLFFLLLATTIQRREEAGLPSLTPFFNEEAIQVSFIEKVGLVEEFGFAKEPGKPVKEELPITGAAIARKPIFKIPAIEHIPSGEKEIKTNLPKQSFPAASAEKNINQASKPKINRAPTNNNYRAPINNSYYPPADRGYHDDISRTEEIPPAPSRTLNQDEQNAPGVLAERDSNNDQQNDDLQMAILIRQLIESTVRADLILQAEYDNLAEQIAQTNYPSFASYPALINTLSPQNILQLISLSGNVVALIGQDNNIYIIQVSPLQQYRLHSRTGILKTVHL